jgi:hypothetical protein
MSSADPSTRTIRSRRWSSTGVVVMAPLSIAYTARIARRWLPIWRREEEGSGVRDAEEVERKIKEREEERRGGGHGVSQLVLPVPSTLG